MVLPKKVKPLFLNSLVLKMNRLAILGASGHGKVLADMAELLSWHQIDFYDDAWPEIQKNGPWPVLGNTQHLLDILPEYQGVIVAIGNNSIRLAKLEQLSAYQAQIVSLVHPAAVVSRYARIGPGSAIMAGAMLNADVCVGIGCIVNTGATVDHDCVLGDGVHISPGANLAGGVLVRKGAWVGIGACVRQLITLGQGSVIGAGSVVIAPVNDFDTMVGNPAKKITLKG